MIYLRSHSSLRAIVHYYRRATLGKLLSILVLLGGYFLPNFARSPGDGVAARQESPDR